MFATVILDSEGEDNDSHDDDALLLPLSVDRFMSKGKLTNANVIPQELPEPDDFAIAHVDNSQAELLRLY